MMTWLASLVAGGTVRAILDFLRSPVGIVVLLALAYGIGWWRGDNHGDRQCETRITASVEAAKVMDAKTAAEMRMQAEWDRVEGEKRLVDAEERIKTYEQELKSRAACELGDDDERVLNPRLPAVGPRPPVRR